MQPFFMYVSIGAFVLLIIILIIVGVAMSQLQAQDSFPPTQNACPDYWDVSSNPMYCGVPLVDNMRNKGDIRLTLDASSGQNRIETNNRENVGLCTGANNTTSFGCKGDGTYLTIDPIPANTKNASFQYILLNKNKSWNTLYPGVSERCAKRSWAQLMNITWDGVTNYNGC